VSRARRRSPGSKLAGSVYDQIRSDIFEFRLLPGTRFSENQIAARARVSRTPVREALFRLEREGYLEVHAKSGWSVRPLNFDLLDHLITGIAHKEPGVGQIGAGVTRAPLACFTQAIMALSKNLHALG